MSLYEYLKNNLNEQQFNAATNYTNSSLILAAAGSGKTRVLTYKIAYLIFELGVSPSDILAVTFTNKAANEMKERIIDIPNNISFSSQKNLNDFDYMIAGNDNNSATEEKYGITKNNLKRVGTFHSIFLKILKYEIEKLEMGYTKNFGVYDAGESLSLIKSVISDLGYKDKIDSKETKWKISNLKNYGITDQKFLHTLESEQDELIAKVYQRYQKQMITSNVLDFDDLLLLPKILFEQNKEVLDAWRNKFKYILVDEAQDTNQIQFDLIKLLSGKDGNVSFIGDDYQSIYGWRGAQMDNFLSVSSYFNDIKTFKLETNYRSKNHIVEAGNSIISNNRKKFDKNIVSNRESNDNIRCFSFKDDYEESMNIVDLIKKMKEDKGFNWGDFAVLYRTNAQSQPFEQILLTEGIPYKVYGGFKFFERKEIKDMIAYIKYLLNSKDSVALKRIINTPNRKIGETSVNKIEDYAVMQGISISEVLENIDTVPIKISSMVTNNIKGFNTMIKFLKNQIDNSNPANIINSILNNTSYKQYLITTEGKDKAEDKMENIGQLINMAEKYNYEGYNGYDLLNQFLEEISILTDLEELGEGEPDAVKLMSVHGSKGLEFSNVFIVGLEENIFPLSKARFDDTQMEEERRLMYVAVTRAKDNLFLSYASSRRQWGQLKYNSHSRFLDEIPQNIIKSYDFLGFGSGVSNDVDFEEGDDVYHKLFGTGTILEVWNEIVVVRFWNEKYGIRKVDSKFLNKN